MTTNIEGTNQASCAEAFEADAISVSEAKKRIFQEITPITGKEKLALRNCLNRYLAEDIYSPINVPAHINSAMDGYAISGKDIPIDSPQLFKVEGVSYAGKPSSKTHNKGKVVRIMTGGIMPVGTDTVIMQEQVELINEQLIRLQPEHQIGQNVRQAGEDISEGCLVFSKGKQITPADLGVLASLGIGELHVYRRPRIAFFSTGDELCSIGEKLTAGKIYDSNRYTLYAMLKQLNVEILDMGIVRDSPKAMREAFLSASQMSDIVITSGGVSVGEADYIKPTLKELGETYFWKVRMKPGRPLTFGGLNSAQHKSWLFGLPGNPVAVMVTFLQFLKPAIHYLASGKEITPLTLQAICTTKLYKRPGRSEYQRGVFEQLPDGKLAVRRTGKQGSGILTSMSIANCFILLAEDSNGAEEGELVEIQPFANTNL